MILPLSLINILSIYYITTLFVVKLVILPNVPLLDYMIATIVSILSFIIIFLSLQEEQLSNSIDIWLFIKILMMQILIIGNYILLKITTQI